MTGNLKLRTVKQLLVISGISILSLSFASADVTLQVDDNIKVTAINGKKFNSSPFQSIKKNFTLQPGTHVITAKYDRLYEFRNDNHDYLRSGNITVTANMQDNQTYRLAMPGQPEKYEEAKKYAKNPSLAVLNGSNVVAQSSGSVEEGGLFSSLTGLFGGDDAQSENQRAIAAVNNNQPVATQSPNVIAPVNTISATPATGVGVSSQAPTSTLDSFMQLWLQATPAEREKIRQWVQQ